MRTRITLIKQIIFILIVFISLSSCQKERLDKTIIENNNIDLLKKFLLNKETNSIQSPDLSLYNQNPITKSYTGNSYSAINVLWSKAQNRINGDYLYIVAELATVKKSAIFSLEDELPDPKFKRSVRTFILYQKCISTNEEKISLCTMINIQENDITASDINPFNLKDFSGIIILSKINGEYMSSFLYRQNRLFKIKPLRKQDSNEDIYFRIHMGLDNVTKGDENPDYYWDRELNELYFYAKEDNPGTTLKDINDDIVIIIGNDQQNINKGGGGSSNTPGDNKIDEEPQELFFRVLLYPVGSSSEEGTTTGSGQYEFGQTVTVAAVPNKGYEFIMWNGDLASMGASGSFSFQITQNITSTAIFHKKTPCRDIDSSRSNPLLKMVILGSKNNGIDGGMYGTGRGSFHKGIDLDAEIGEPVYAMFDGIVENAVDRYDPNVPYDKYDELYKQYGERDYNAGNRVQIRSAVNGKTITQKYFHLHSVFVNRGQTVKAGDIIGYSGDTGNAKSKESNGPHLHLEIYLNGRLEDPILYLYTIFNKEGKIIRDCKQ